MGSQYPPKSDLDRLEDSVVEEIIRYCADCGVTPNATVMAETIEARRERSGPGRMQELYSQVEERVRRRLQI